MEQARTRLAASRTVPQRPAWHPPSLADFARGVLVLAFDASLSNTGWVAFLVTAGGVDIQGHGTIKPKAADGGYLGTWQKAYHLRKRLWEENLVLRYMRQPDVLKAVEAPVVGAGHRKESSLIAGMTVWMECDPVEVVSATHVSAVLLGDPRIRSDVRKPAVKEAVCRLVPEAAGRGWDEHQRDALGVGFTMLYDLKEEQ
jgi:hypothetical protein